MLTGGDSITAGIPYYQNQLDHLAKTLAHVFNSKVHADDPAQPDKYKELLSGDGNGNITAGNISISDKWAEDSSYIFNHHIRQKEMMVYHHHIGVHRFFTCFDHKAIFIFIRRRRASWRRSWPP